MLCFTQKLLNLDILLVLKKKTFAKEKKTVNYIKYMNAQHFSKNLPKKVLYGGQLPPFFCSNISGKANKRHGDVILGRSVTVF